MTSTVLEIVLDIDNVIFISVIVSRILPVQAKCARQIGLLLALVADGFKFHIPRNRRSPAGRFRLAS